MHGVPRTTIRCWHNQIKTDAEWIGADTRWGEHRRIVDGVTESALATYIRITFSRQHRLFTSEDFPVVADVKYCEVYRDADDARRFCCSPVFIHGVMVRNHFSIRREHIQRRPPISEEDTAILIQRLRHLLATEKNDLILN
jgi:hypothetical protein